MFRKLRILILLIILALVAGGNWLRHARLTDWDEPVWVVVYPIAGDASATTRGYLERLRGDRLLPLQDYFRDQAKAHGLHATQVFKVALGPILEELPPAPPAEASVLAVVWWSLRLRYWAWRHEDASLLGDISVFVVYHDPATNPTIPHSLGLKEGHIGVVHAFASNDMTQTNNVVIAHELLHTLGATDKYDPATNLPLYPEGYVDPGREPRYPQDKAEIMAGRIPLAPGRASIPRHLAETEVGRTTASEIGW